MRRNVMIHRWILARARKLRATIHQPITHEVRRAILVEVIREKAPRALAGPIGRLP